MEVDLVRKNEDKFCRVCGDKSLGYNFSVISCESCKAFFRRNAVKNKKHKCPFQNDCKIDVVTRRFCQKCRLQKCLVVGMKKEWIMSEKERLNKNAKISVNRLKKRFETSNHNVMCSTASSFNPDSLLTVSDNAIHDVFSKPHARVNAMPHQPTIPLTYPDNRFISPEKQTRMVVDNSPWQSLQSLSLPSMPLMGGTSPENSSLRTSCSSADSAMAECSSDKSWLSNTMSNVLNTVILSEYSELANKSGLDSFGSRILTSLELEKIEELILANEHPNFRKMDDKLLLKKISESDPRLIDLINMTDNAIRKLIKMSKRITAFKNLCQEDQIALLKGGCTELMILRSVMTYDSEKDGWEVPDITYIKMDILKAAKGNIYEEHKRFVHSFDPTWRSDESLMLILTAVVLFTPTRPNVVHAQIVEKEQYSYFFLLQRYLQSKSSDCGAKVNFMKLVQTVQDLQKLNENHVRVYLDVNPKDVEPLLIEIFDLSR